MINILYNLGKARNFLYDFIKIKNFLSDNTIPLILNGKY